MDFSCDIEEGFPGWFRGLPYPSQLFTAFKEDFLIYVVGPLLRYVRIEAKKGPNRVRVLQTMRHEFDGVSCIEANPVREVYALAEKSVNPRIHIYRIDRGTETPYEARMVANLSGVQATEIRAMRFNRKEMIMVLTGYPSFSVSIWKWTTEQELMVALCNEPSTFSDLLINPINDCHWVEYGYKHLTFFDLQSFTKNDVIRTQIYLPQRQLTYNRPDPLMGQPHAMRVISACFTALGDFYVLDDHLGLHILNQEDKVLNWLCSIGYSFLESPISMIVPYGDCIAEVRKDGWILAYDIATNTGKLRIVNSFKLTSNPVKYWQFPGAVDSFFAITEREGLVECVQEGKPREPFAIPDLLFNSIRGITFIEPKEDFCAVISETGRVFIVDTSTGAIIERWRLPYEPTSILSHPKLPFIFFGTSTGCVLAIDIGNIKRPRLITRTYLSKDKGAVIEKMATVCQGRYLVSADTTNDRLFLQYGYPFEEFDYLDSARLPGEIRHLNVPPCGKEDLRIQVMVYAKNKVDEVCPNFVYNFALNNDRLTLVASQSIENPVGAIGLAQLKKYLYTYHVDKKQLAMTPFCDDNSWTVLQEPELWVDTPIQSDINRLITHGDKLYAFGADGKISVYEPPVQKERDQPILLNTICQVQTHLFVDGGIRDGMISLDGTLAIAIGFDGTFTCVRLFDRPEKMPWELLGYDKPHLLQYQLGSYAIDQQNLLNAKIYNRVSYAVKDGELAAPELWAKNEYNLQYKQHFPRAIQLKAEFKSMVEMIYNLINFNSTREPLFQLTLPEFNLDEDMEDVIEEKAVKYVQYCHIQMQARNKLRKDRIASYKNMIWDPYIHKGRIFMGFQNPVIVPNYPIKSEEELFGKQVSQCEEERRLELRIESAEDEIGEIGNSITLAILKQEVDLVPPEHRQLYIKSIMSLDPLAKFEDYEEIKETEEIDDDYFQNVFQQLGVSAAGMEDSQSEANSKKQMMPFRVIRRGKAAEKTVSAFGGHVQTKRKEVSEPNTASTTNQSRQRRHRRKKKVKKQTESVARQRLLHRRRLMEQGLHMTEEEEPEVEEHHHHHHHHHHFHPNSSHGKRAHFGEEEEEAKESSSSSSSSDESVAPSKKDLLEKIKPSKIHLEQRGVFGPRKRGKRGVREGVQVILEPDRKKKRCKYNDRSGKNDKDKKKKRRIRKVRSKDTFVVESESDPEVDDDEAFLELKMQKIALMDEEQAGPYKNVEKLFAGNLLYELEEMHQYKRNPYHYHQFELHARHQLVRQIQLAFNEIYRLKAFFNKLFEQARNYKTQTLRKMAERNERIRDLYYYLKLDLDILDDKFSPLEDPAQVFTVTKDEIPIERYLTAEQRAEEERLRLEAIARKNTRMAKFRRRALKVMMDNKLEVLREEILVKEIPKPRFMFEKDPMEYSLDEYIEAMEYKEACEELDKARAYLVKELQQELHTLYKANALDYNGIDQRLQELFMARKQFHYNILMAECAIQRIVKLLRITDDCQHEEDRVNGMLVKLQDGMKSIQMLVAQLSARRNECRDKNADIAEKQKELEKRFRKDLGDVGQFFEFFIKNYKRKPKISAKGMDRSEIYEKGVKALMSTNIRAFARENGDAGKAVVMAIMDIEDPMLMPVGCPRSYWDKFVKLRRQRLAIDFEIKGHALEMKHISEGLEECKEREDETAKAMAAMLAILSHRTEMKNYFLYNTEFQFITGKGNVEINFWDADEHSHAVMTLSKNIERLNAHIAIAAEGYIQDIRRTMLVHRDVREVEWHFRVVHMALSDVQQLLHDVNNSKPRKELLKVLRQGVNLETMYEDRMNLVRYLQATSIKFQKIYLGVRRRLRRMYERQTEHQIKVNDDLKSWLSEQNKATSILKTTGLKATPEQRAKKHNDRVNQFLIKGYMVRKVHDNYQTINYMEGELSRYYQKSYPCL